MKLKQIYSNSNKFKPVRFNEQFNIILGDIKYASDLNMDSHNLGKSTLIYLIDFMFLRELDKDFFLANRLFTDHIFYMEVKLNSGMFLTIKRAVQNSTKISFKLHNNAYQDFTCEYSWDYQDLSINAKNENENAIRVLNRLLGFDVLPNESYRKTFSYFFRSQSDYFNVFKLNKFRGKDLDWKPTLFELLGFSGKHMVDKYNLDIEKSQKLKLIEQIESEFKVSEADIDKIKGLIEIKSEEKNKVINWLDNFDFYAQDNRVEKNIIQNIEEKISYLNSERYDVDFEINEINKSINESVNCDIESIQKIYEEVGVYWPDLLIKEYKELLHFNEKVFHERKQYLQKALESKEKRLIDIDQELVKLNEQRKESMSTFTQSDTFEKYNRYRNSLISAEKDISKYTTELENVDVIKSLNKEISKIDKQIEDAVDALKDQVEVGNDIYRSIRKDFHDFAKAIINHESMISLSVNSKGNVEFKDTIVDENNEVTAQNKGHTYKKVLCACFDLALIKNYSDRSYYKTVYHDGCLESLDPRKQKQYLELVRRLSQTYDIQYILTALKSDIPSDELGKYLPKDSEIALTLSDESDDSGRLFGFSF